MPRIVGVVVDGAGQRGAEAGQMGAAILLRDVVGEAQTGLVIGVGPFHRHLDGDAVALADDGDGRACSAVFERSRQWTKASMPPS